MIITVGSQLKDENGNVYILDSLLGNGGFGNVYCAHRESDGKLFALKTLLYSFPNAESLTSFQNEIKLALLPKSKYTIEYQYAHDGTKYPELPPYIIMEYADGGTLTDLITAQQKAGSFFDVQTLINMFLQLASGMDVISKILVHRDIKPDNILLCNNVIKISDFGLSKLAGENTRTLTFKGYGTAKYVAPEAWNNDRNTIQMDIYSMGIVFYELATLQYPYSLTSNPRITDYQNAHLYQSVRNPITINSRLPANIVSIILRMLEKPTQRRFINWIDIINALNTEKLPESNMNNILERAIQTRNEIDIQIQKQNAEVERQTKERDNFCQLVYSQFIYTIHSPIQEFVDKFNIQYAGVAKMQLSKSHGGSSSSPRFVETITTPSNRISIEFEVIFKDNFTRKVAVDRIFRDSGYRTENYVPKCNNREVLGWGRVSEKNSTGFNLLLLKSGEMLYGDWFVLTNSSSGLSRTQRPSPFGFELNELPKEIELIRAIHIYNSDLSQLNIDIVLNFIASHV